MAPKAGVEVAGAPKEGVLCPNPVVVAPKGDGAPNAELDGAPNAGALLMPPPNGLGELVAAPNPNPPAGLAPNELAPKAEGGDAAPKAGVDEAPNAEVDAAPNAGAEAAPNADAAPNAG